MINSAPNQSQALERTKYASKEAGTFDVYEPRWVLSHTQPQGMIIPHFNEWPIEQKEALLRTLAQRSTKYQAKSILAELSSLKTFTRAFATSEDFSETGIDVENLLRWLTSKRHEEIKLKIRRLILAADEYGYGGVFEEGVLSIAKQYSGKRTRLNPERFEGSRSYTESERKQLYYQLARESHLGKIPFEVEISSTLILVTGKRPKQITSSKFIDFTFQEVKLGHGDKRKVITYNVPVVKQKGQSFRKLFNPMPIVSSFNIWENLKKLKESNTTRMNELFRINLTNEQALLLPIMLPSSNDEILDRFERSIKQGLSIDEFLSSDRLHLDSSAASSLVQQLNQHIKILSEYTEKALTINAKRFRHTRATHLALSGASIEEISDALDHSDNRTAADYIDNLPARAVKIGAEIEDTLGVLAKKFAGIDVGNSDKVIQLYTKNGTHNVGICGMESFCSENYPIACYECELFSPNPFGNHTAVQEYVETKIEEAKGYGDSRLLENWHTILLAVLERRYVADQQRIQMLNEAPEILKLEYEEVPQ